MIIHKNYKTCLVFECGCEENNSWLRLERITNEQQKQIEIDKAAMCCDIRLNHRNMFTFMNWLVEARLWMQA